MRPGSSSTIQLRYPLASENADYRYELVREKRTGDEMQDVVQCNSFGLIRQILQIFVANLSEPKGPVNVCGD